MARPKRGRGVRHFGQRLAGWAASGLAAVAERLERLAGPTATPPGPSGGAGTKLPDAPAHWPEPWAAVLRERAPHLLEGGFLSYRTPPEANQAGPRPPQTSPAPPRGDRTAAAPPRGATAGPSGAVPERETSTWRGVAGGVAGGRDEPGRGRARYTEPPPVTQPSGAAQPAARADRAQPLSGHGDEPGDGPGRRGGARQDPPAGQEDGRPAAGTAARTVVGAQPERAERSGSQPPPRPPGSRAERSEPSPAEAAVAAGPAGTGPPVGAGEVAASAPHHGVPEGPGAFVQDSPGMAVGTGHAAATPAAPVPVTASPEPGTEAAAAPDLRFVAEHPATLEAALAWVAEAGRASPPAPAEASFDPPRAPERLWPPLPQPVLPFATRPEARPHAGEGAHLARLAREQEGR